MALITIERFIPTTIQNNLILNSTEEKEKQCENDLFETTNNMLSECYIVVRGADIIFPYNECHRFSKSSHKSILNDIQKHLQAILKLLRPQDRMKMAVRLESQLSSNRTRYLLVVSNGTDESCLLGIDYETEATIGLVLEIWNDITITLDGDGGFRITSGIRHHIFKPVSVQAMWSAFQALHMANKKSIINNYYANGGSHSWVSYYQERIKSNTPCLQEWHTITDLTEVDNKLYELDNKPEEEFNFEELVTYRLKEIMMSVDLEQVTSKDIRNKLEEHFQRDLREYKSYIDKEMIRIMGQMDEASKILDYLYLGSEWNASNFEELKGKGVKKILNVTCEIDNFFPGFFEYRNIRVLDDDSTDMLRHLNDTYYYIRKAKDEGVKVLVHCKKGISRSASVVVAYIMKEKNCDLYEALEYVKNLRSNIRPNPEFLKQLEIYQGMLNANNNKNNVVWRSNSESDLKDIFSKKSKSKNCDHAFSSRHKMAKQEKSNENKENFGKYSTIHRRRSWPPKDSNDSSYILMKNESKINSRRARYSIDPSFYFDNKYKSEARSRVKERIEDFENCFHPNNMNTNLKKNVAKNGFVSNLACQFESKDKAMNDLSNLDQYSNHQKSNYPKPSLTRMVKPSLSSFGDIELVISHSENISLDLMKSINTKCQFLDRILKRTLSCDNIFDMCKSFDSSDIILKKYKPTFPMPSGQQKLSIAEHLKHKLYKSHSLPNISFNSLSFKRKINQNYNIFLFRQTYFKSGPLDLRCYKTCLNKQKLDNQFDGFVKRRTEELESNKCCSVPSSPNLNGSTVFKSANNNLQKEHKSGSSIPQFLASKSFDFSMPKCNYMTDNNSLSSNIKQHTEKNDIILKKTYGRSHPLDKLYRNNCKRSN